MLIVAVGVNHRTAPVEVREKLSFPAHSLPDNLKRLQSYSGIDGCAIISTCNRTEIYVTPYELDDGLNAVWQFLSEHSGLDISEIKNCTFCHTLYDAVRHLFRVSAGLDSMILGETQILGQVRDAYENALQAGTTNTIINTLFKQAIVVGKRVRTETGIDKNAVSVSYAAVELAKQKFGDLNGRSVLVVGAGKMSELTAKHLVSNGVSGVIVSNRSYDRAEILAEKFQGIAVKFEELFKHMMNADIVISSTAARHYVIRYPDMLELIHSKENKNLMFIDIAVPRDVDPQVGEIPGVTLYDIDDLQMVVDNNLTERRQSAVLAEGIIEEELSEFLKWLSTQFVIPTIAALRDMGEEIKQNELQRAYNRLGKLTPREHKVISTMASTIVKQLLHLPIVRLKEYALTTEGHLYTEVLQNLFDLEVKGQRPKHKESAKIDMMPWMESVAESSKKHHTGGYNSLKQEIIVGTRESALAMWQTNWVVAELQKKYPDRTFKITKMKTQGDKILDVALAKIGDKGLFTKELEVGMLENRIDLAVHSMKDLPTKLPDGLIIGAICQREYPGDVLVNESGKKLDQLPEGARIGTSSLRRSAQLLKFRPDLKLESLRGNLNTRMKKLQLERLDGIVLAAAGMIRMGWKDKITQFIPHEICLPAVGQGSIGIEIRANDPEILEIVQSIADDDATTAITAERALLRKLEGGCQVPIGAYGQVVDNKLYLEAIVISLDGTKAVMQTIEGAVEQAAELGLELANRLLEQGAGDILEQVRKENDQ